VGGAGCGAAPTEDRSQKTEAIKQKIKDRSHRIFIRLPTPVS
jgi:hypothetical protein